MAIRHEPLAPQLLEGLYQHRLVTGPQLHAMYSPAGNPGWTWRVLTGLAAKGFVDKVRLRPPASAAAWFLTEAGAELVERSHPGRWSRRYLVTPDVARGPLQAHMLAENDLGIAFMAAARRLGHEFGPLGWRHEVAHKLPDQKGSVICDVLLHYVATDAGSQGGNVVLWRFVEVDRGTMSQAVLVEKLQDYVALYRAYKAGPGAPGGKTAHPPRWLERYPSFPPVIVVLTNAPHRVLMERIRSLSMLCCHDLVVGASDLPIVFTTLEDLETRGPFEPVFWEPGQPERPVDVLGRRGAPSRDRASRSSLRAVQQTLVEA